MRSATEFGQWNRNRLLRQPWVLFAHLTPGPLMGVNDLPAEVDRPFLAEQRPSAVPRTSVQTSTSVDCATELISASTNCPGTCVDHRTDATCLKPQSVANRESAPATPHAEARQSTPKRIERCREDSGETAHLKPA